MQTQRPHTPRYHVFLLDLGWQTENARVIHENLGVINACLGGCPLFVLNREQSLAVLQRDPHLIGSDPCLIVHDTHVLGHNGGDGYHGFRLSLGRAKDGQEALRLFQDFLRFVAEHSGSPDIQKDLSKKLHREGLAQTIELLRHSI
ncbi:hypothetical protein [Methylomagnum ishizawai]|uniref:hypothetical protein n=1 Tax=Methylomagnum ishizawai TaxID=1760988 RepID=UPI001C32FF81|nr:hypothetical protein [Methylomagnum ishizawai]BBL74400.1 hypothetical protein MishRS11D_14980 [Methylomagnum ishizawai]